MKLVESTSPIIRTKTTDVTEADLPFVQSQLGLMWQVMLDNNGIGLAATQVGFGKNFFIHKCNEDGTMEVIINPTIKTKSDSKISFPEGCLSLPGKNSPKDWDFAAPHAILKSAGGAITNIDNQDLTYGKSNFHQGGIIVASSNNIHHGKICSEIKKLIKTNNLYPFKS